MEDDLTTESSEFILSDLAMFSLTILSASFRTSSSNNLAFAAASVSISLGDWIIWVVEEERFENLVAVAARGLFLPSESALALVSSRVVETSFGRGKEFVEASFGFENMLHPDSKIPIYC